jgi:hypothetical protein
MKRFAVCAILLFAITGNGTCAQSRLETAQAWGEDREGLRLGISGIRTARSTGANFIVALQNTSTSDFVVNLGHMLGNGAMFSSAIRLALTGPAGDTRELHFFDRPGVAGWLGDYTVALRPGATYTLPVSLDQYWNGAAKVTLPTGRHQIAAQFEGNGATLNREMQLNLHSWKGTVRSSVFEFEVTP